MKTLLIGGASLIAILLIAFFVMKAKKKKEEQEAQVRAAEEAQEVANFGKIASKPYIGKKPNTDFPLKLGSKSGKVEQLQRFLDKTYQEKTGEGILHLVKIGEFDNNTLAALQEQLGVSEVSEEIYRKYTDYKGRRIAQFQTKL